jgi:thiol-disulfide isomerase/thioredoxin
MEVIERNRDPEVKAEFLLEALMVARVEGIGKERARSNFARLTMDYSASKAAELARMYLTPSKRVKVGEKLPAFRFRDVRDSSRYVRNATFRGKVFLMDFWATSCPPCVAEMPALHRVYDTYRPRGFDIISVSIGDISTNLFAFFRTRDSMPWTNVLLADEERAAVMETFELQGVPWPILVDSGGKIIALHSEVRGENLELTVRKALGLPKR